MFANAVSDGAQTVLLTTFFVRDSLLALDAAGIHEVIRLGPITPVHHGFAEVAGIVNLRGKIVTILDLGLRLGFAKAVPGADSRIFIVEQGGEFIGLLVDRVDEVVEVDPGQCQRPPANVPAAQARFFRGVCRARDRVITVLDSGQVLADAPQ